ncbi:hypothetical protein LZ198_00455 [Myxococcus sp. K15C18031901]|uniref:hypothetical protein n=1 Tax=Myxococcus dinghuensis TaxID=2906761 RepID=UPI0020A7774F|nr:hypothetical protein [Myxococcus dinghuensis]MCP3097335.1 hypothetical protein [Myxococcus dinghuensis]
MSTSRRCSLRALALLVTAGALLAGCEPEPPGAEPVTQTQSSPLQASLAGDTSCVWGSPDCNLCVPDVPARFNALRDHGEVLGFHRGGFDFNVAYPGGNHWQGVQRLPRDAGRILVLSKRDDRAAGNVGHVVHMVSRNGEGLRWRSNRLSPTISQPEDTAPPASDRAVTALPLVDGYAHGGGMQAVGNIVALPMEQGPGAGRVAFYDFNTSLAPSPFAFVEGLSSDAGTASLTRLSDQRYLLLLGQYDAKTLEVFRSSETDLRSSANRWVRVDTWQQGELVSGQWGAFQGLTFLTDCNDGQLYLVGTYLKGSEDHAFLYRVDASGHLRIEQVASKHLYCTNDGPRQCNLDAAGGVFVGPDRNLVLYATEHADDGPSGSVKMMEFRSIVPNVGCGVDLARAYVDFYDDSDFSDRGFIFDSVDRDLKNWARFQDVDGLNDKVSAVRWCIPLGHRVRLYQDSNHAGGYKDLVGDGTAREVNLNTWSFGDKTSSARWLAF